MNKIISFKMFESPDFPASSYQNDSLISSNLDGEADGLHYESTDAFPFGYIKNDLIKPELIKDNLPTKDSDYTMLCGEFGTTHDKFSNDTFIRKQHKICGRIWLERKYISFWHLPSDYNELIQTIKDIDKAYKILFNKNLNIYNDRENWLMEVKNKKEDQPPVSKIIKLTEYLEGEQLSDEELEAPHLMKYADKKKYFQEKGIKPKTPKSLDLKQAMLKSEKVIIKFDNF